MAQRIACLVFVVLFVTAFTTQSPGQTTYYVGPSGSDATGDGTAGVPFATLQHAINQAAAGDTVSALPGVYTGPGNRDVDFLGKAITVRSRDEDPATCTVEVGGSALEPHRGFIFQNAESAAAVLLGFTITGGYADESGGGGILLQGSQPPAADGASPAIRKCNIVGNEGCGIMARGEQAKPTFEDCTVSDNTGNGIAFEWGSGTFSRCTISRNTGSGLYALAADAVQTLTDCTVSHNGNNGIRVDLAVNLHVLHCTIEANGSDGIYYAGDMSSITLVDSDVLNNVGAGVETYTIWNTTSIQNCRIIGNGLHGVRLDSPYYDSVIQDSEIYDNGGRGVELSGIGKKKSRSAPSAKLPDTKTSIINCRIGSNASDGIGGTPSFSSGKAVVVTDCLVHDNTGDGLQVHFPYAADAALAEVFVARSTLTGNSGRGLYSNAESLDLQTTLISNNGLQSVELGIVTSLIVTCNDLFANVGGDWVDALAGMVGVDGNVSALPLFCSSAGNDYSLMSTSPCLAINQPAGLTCGQIGSDPEGCTFDGNYYVSTSGSDTAGNGTIDNPFATIQLAIDLAADGDEVVILPGTFTGDGNRDIDFLGKAISVHSQDENPLACIIDCQGTEAEPHRGFIFRNQEGPESVLAGLTITNGYASEGSGIAVFGIIPWEVPGSGASPTIRRCNISHGFGTAIWAGTQECRLLMFDCIVSSNIGGGVAINTGGISSLERCQITDNSGVGVTDIFNSALTMTDCLVSGNGSHGTVSTYATGRHTLVRCTITNNGGEGIQFSGDEQGIEISDCDVTGNTGAGIASWGDYHNTSVFQSRVNDNGLFGIRLSGSFSTSTVLGTEVLRNGGWGIDVNFTSTATTFSGTIPTISNGSLIQDCIVGQNAGGGIGGRLEIQFSEVVYLIADCLVFENLGDGIGFLSDGPTEDPTHLTITSTTIANNDGRGIYVENDTLTVSHTLVAANGQEGLVFGGVASFDITCSDLYDNGAGDWLGLSLHSLARAAIST